MVELLLEEGAELNSLYPTQFCSVLHMSGRLKVTPLISAIRFTHSSKRMEMIKLLLSRGADPRIADTMGVAPVVHAAEIQEQKVLGEILHALLCEQCEALVIHTPKSSGLVECLESDSFWKEERSYVASLIQQIKGNIAPWQTWLTECDEERLSPLILPAVRAPYISMELKLQLCALLVHFGACPWTLDASGASALLETAHALGPLGVLETAHDYDDQMLLILLNCTKYTYRKGWQWPILFLRWRYSLRKMSWTSDPARKAAMTWFLALRDSEENPVEFLNECFTQANQNNDLRLFWEIIQELCLLERIGAEIALLLRASWEGKAPSWVMHDLENCKEPSMSSFIYLTTFVVFFEDSDRETPSARARATKGTASFRL
jgi:hypothetical protein